MGIYQVNKSQRRNEIIFGPNDIEYKFMCLPYLQNYFILIPKIHTI
jgi:hypothetical protein